MKKKVAIQTLKLYTNYGGILQAYALQYILSKQGYDVVHLNRFNRTVSPKATLKLFIHKLLNPQLHSSIIKANRIFSPFIERYINYSEPLYNFDEWRNYVEQHNFDAVIVGSDQVWRIDYVKAFVNENFLNFYKHNTKKISYAASFGNDKMDEDYVSFIKDKLADFDAISVREKSGLELIKNNFDIIAEHLIDPTLLLDKEAYVKIFSLKKTSNRPFVLSYVLDKNDKKLSITNLVKEKKNLGVKFVYGTEITKGNFRDKDIGSKVSVETWLEYFYNAEYVVTDSFHGMVFSIIFNKPFLVIANKQRGVSRFVSLLEQLGMSNRLIFENISFDDISLDQNLDYEEINRKVALERERAINYLHKNI